MPAPKSGVDVANDATVGRIEHNSRVTEGTWHGMAYLIESILLLAFIVAAITVFFELFSYSENIATNNNTLSDAVVYATNTAEMFAASPELMKDYGTERDDYHITCNVTEREAAAGTLYDAVIEVTSVSSGEVLYTLNTTNYVSSNGASDEAADVEIADEVEDDGSGSSAGSSSAAGSTGSSSITSASSESEVD